MNDDSEELTTSAQAGDIQDALEKAGLWKKEKEVGELLNTAKVPEEVKVYTKITVDSKLNVKILVTTKPSHASGGTLAKLLNQKYAGPMKAALQKAKLNVEDTMELSWLKFE
jgi:hypothetical protein